MVEAGAGAPGAAAFLEHRHPGAFCPIWRRIATPMRIAASVRLRARNSPR